MIAIDIIVLEIFHVILSLDQIVGFESKLIRVGMELGWEDNETEEFEFEEEYAAEYETPSDDDIMEIPDDVAFGAPADIDDTPVPPSHPPPPAPHPSPAGASGPIYNPFGLDPTAGIPTIPRPAGIRRSRNVDTCYFRTVNLGCPALRKVDVAKKDCRKLMDCLDVIRAEFRTPKDRDVGVSWYQFFKVNVDRFTFVFCCGHV